MGSRISEKKNVYRFNVSFDPADPVHQQAVVLLNNAGRKKASLIAKALLADSAVGQMDAGRCMDDCKAKTFEGVVSERGGLNVDGIDYDVVESLIQKAVTAALKAVPSASSGNLSTPDTAKAVAENVFDSDADKLNRQTVGKQSRPGSMEQVMPAQKTPAQLCPNAASVKSNGLDGDQTEQEAFSQMLLGSVLGMRMSGDNSDDD